MPNPLIKEINATKLNNWEDALKLLKITNNPPSVTEINKAFRRLALELHPDRNKEEEEIATQACAKLANARDFLLQGNKDINFDQASFGSASVGAAIFNSWFDENQPYMTGSIVLEARNILLSWAGIFKNIDGGTDEKDVRAWFEKFLSGNNNLTGEDKNDLSQYVSLLFPDGYVPSHDIAKKFNAAQLNDNIAFLQDLMIREPQFRKPYQTLFQAKIVLYLQETEKSLSAIIKSSGLEEEFSSKPLINLTRFEEFAYAFIGLEKPSVMDISIHDPALLEAYSLLDACITQNAQLFSNLIHAANLLREQIDKNAPFLYSETNLHPNDPDNAKALDKLCNQYTQLQVLNAQLAHIIRPILGDDFTKHLPEVLQSGFPEIRCIIIMKRTNEFRRYKFVNQLTDATWEEVWKTGPFPTIITEPNNEIAPVIPHLPINAPSVIASYRKNWPTANAFEFLAVTDGRVYGDLGPCYDPKCALLNTAIANALEKTWAPVIKKQMEKPRTSSEIDSPKHNVQEPFILSNPTDITKETLEKDSSYPPSSSPSNLEFEVNKSLTQETEEDSLLHPQQETKENSLLESQQKPSPVYPVYNAQREDLIQQLTNYIKRIESHKTGDANDYAYNFWFFAKPRALNRKANYELAKQLLTQLTEGNNIDQVFSPTNIEAQRPKPNLPWYGVEGIHSDELNRIIENGQNYIKASQTMSKSSGK